MASKREYATRFSMFMLAVLFLLTSVGVSIFVIIQARQQQKSEKAAQTAQTDAATKAADTNKTPPDTSENKKTNSETTSKEGKLEGTKLQGFDPVASVASLQKIDLTNGTGTEVKSGDTVTAHYTGALAKDGTIFQSSHDSGKPFTSPLSNLIKGWQEGIPGMKEGGKRRLLIPAAQAYGAAEQPGIPANSDLVFDIEMVKVGQ